MFKTVLVSLLPHLLSSTAVAAAGSFALKEALALDPNLHAGLQVAADVVATVQAIAKDFAAVDPVDAAVETVLGRAAEVLAGEGFVGKVLTFPELIAYGKQAIAFLNKPLSSTATPTATVVAQAVPTPDVAPAPSENP